jgi:putative MATE family efflux protein
VSAAPTPAVAQIDGRHLDRRIVGLAIPALGALVTEPLYNLADTGIVGHLGKGPLGGLALAGAALDVLSWLGAFLTTVTTSVVAHRAAAGDRAGLRRAAGSAYLLAVLIGLVIAGLIELLAGPALGVSGAAAASRRAGLTYLRIAAIGQPFLLLQMAGTGHLNGLEDTRRPFAIAVVANAINVGLEVLFVYGLHLGIAGSAWGTVGAQIISAALFLVVARRLVDPPGRPRRHDVVEMLRDGVPVTVRTAFLGVVLLSTTVIAAGFGAVRLAAHQIVLQTWLALALIVDSLAVPAQVYVGQALGAADVAQARRVGSRCLRLGLVVGGATGALLLATSLWLPKLFSADPGVDRAATVALIVCALQQPVAAAAFVLDGLYFGATDYRYLQRTMVISALVYAPLAAGAALVPGVGLPAVWVATGCWLTCRTVLLWRRWRRGGWEVRRRPAEGLAR